MTESPVQVGIDLVQVREIERSIADFGDHFVTRVFTEHEIAWCRQAPSAAGERFAARFAAKEAAVKVLRPGDVGMDLRTIEVRRTEEGWTELLLHGTAEQLAKARGFDAFSVSLSHEGDYAAAVVVGYRSGGTA
jgi:holo-[acyl-carrier protein] synthase